MASRPGSDLEHLARVGREDHGRAARRGCRPRGSAAAVVLHRRERGHALTSQTWSAPPLADPVSRWPSSRVRMSRSTPYLTTSGTGPSRRRASSGRPQGGAQQRGESLRIGLQFVERPRIAPRRVEWAHARRGTRDLWTARFECGRGRWPGSAHSCAWAGLWKRGVGPARPRLRVELLVADDPLGDWAFSPARWSYTTWLPCLEQRARVGGEQLRVVPCLSPLSCESAVQASAARSVRDFSSAPAAGGTACSQPARDGVAQRRLGGEVAVDAAVAHPERLGDRRRLPWRDRSGDISAASGFARR